MTVILRGKINVRIITEEDFFFFPQKLVCGALDLAETSYRLSNNTTYELKFNCSKIVVENVTGLLQSALHFCYIFLYIYFSQNFFF